MGRVMPAGIPTPVDIPTVPSALAEAVLVEAGVELAAGQAEEAGGLGLVVPGARESASTIISRSTASRVAGPLEAAAGEAARAAGLEAEVTPSGRWSLVMRPPSHRITARSMALRSSRTFPGHG